MTQDELIDSMNMPAGLSNEQAQSLLSALGEALCNYCKGMDAVAIPGFGTFQPVKTDEHVEVDTSTGKKMLLPPSIVIALKSSVVLRKKFVG